jgi:hypothetical protein
MIVATTAYLKYLRIAWRAAPWLILAIVGLRWWMAPPAGSSSAPGQTVTVAGEQALTKKARKWKKRPPAICEPGPGDAGGRFKVVTREPPADELERMARQYGFTFGDRELSADLAGMPMPEASAPEKDAPPQVAVSRMFGEYTAPHLRYAGTVAAALLVDGELEMRFDPAPPPKFVWLGVWGAGGSYDATFGTPDDERRHRIYGLLEPFQTKQVYWRLEAGAEHLVDGWEPEVRINGEWRSEPWIPKSRRGLRAVKIPE